MQLEYNADSVQCCQGGSIRSCSEVLYNQRLVAPHVFRNVAASVSLLKDVTRSTIEAASQRTGERKGVAMSLDDVEALIKQHLATGPSNAMLRASLETHADRSKLYVIKYTVPKFLSDILLTESLFASRTPGYTWGDAVYVAPLSSPRSTMMYGAAGVIGWLAAENMIFYDAVDSRGIEYYQEWITYFRPLYTQLTTTVHADHANQELRNKFRSRFGIDCILFRPDETCAGYVDDTEDLWLAITQWGPTRQVANGRSQVVRDLKWCAIATESFEPDGLGYRALLHPTLSSGQTFKKCPYSTLHKNLRSAYLSSTPTVVITGF
jgi:hypothetical protein